MIPNLTQNQKGAIFSFMQLMSSRDEGDKPLPLELKYYDEVYNLIGNGNISFASPMNNFRDYIPVIKQAPKEIQEFIISLIAGQALHAALGTDGMSMSLFNILLVETNTTLDYERARDILVECDLPLPPQLLFLYLDDEDEDDFN